MGWEIISAGHNRYGDRFGPNWTSRPAVAITRKGILCNKLFKDAFSFRDKDNVNVFFDSNRKKIGFQRPVSDAAALVSYKVQEEGKNLLITCFKAANKFEDHLDKAFPATLNSTEKIIEVQLS